MPKCGTVWMAKSGSASQTGPPPAVEPPVLVPLHSPDAPGWVGGGTKNGTATDNLAAGFGPPPHLNRARLLPPRPLLPLVSINECDRSPVTIKGNPKVGQLAQGRQHHSPWSWGGGGERGEKDPLHCTNCILVSRIA